VGEETEGAPTLNTLCSRDQFRLVYERGEKFHTPFFSVFMLPTNERGPRYGITVTRKLGCGVIRNRCKRRLREVIRREVRPLIESETGCHIVINVRRATVNAPFQQLSEALAGAFGQWLDRRQALSSK
jgi:ribonuclease P protein component